ncbi:MAG: CpsD/CapB family tyrosine-protein kinase [candidate division KSB1 bacterium]|nr:CpsD/CapB family tyrosine-protein kinase [candidate division KSB1 bacterium]
MSYIHEILYEAEGRPRTATAARQEINGGLFVLSMPREITSDFYDLREHIRILNLRQNVQVLSIADTTAHEGSATIATYLSFLLGGGILSRLKEKQTTGGAMERLWEKSECDQIFTQDFRRLTSQPPVNGKLFSDWQKQTDSPFVRPREKQGVLLVDADMATPSIHRFFGVPVEGGLAELIETQGDWRESARPVTDSNLWVLTAGKPRVNPVELLSSDAFAQLLETWRAEFQYVVFNSPAVLTRVEALTLAAAVDGVIIVVRAGLTRWESAQRAKQRLTAAQANLLGVTLNRRKLDIPDGLYRRLL